MPKRGGALTVESLPPRVSLPSESPQANDRTAVHRIANPEEANLEFAIVKPATLGNRPKHPFSYLK